MLLLISFLGLVDRTFACCFTKLVGQMKSKYINLALSVRLWLCPHYAGILIVYFNVNCNIVLYLHGTSVNLPYLCGFQEHKKYLQNGEHTVFEL